MSANRMLADEEKARADRCNVNEADEPLTPADQGCLAAQADEIGTYTCRCCGRTKTGTYDEIMDAFSPYGYRLANQSDEIEGPFCYNCLNKNQVLQREPLPDNHATISRNQMDAGEMREWLAVEWDRILAGRVFDFRRIEKLMQRVRHQAYQCDTTTTEIEQNLQEDVDAIDAQA